MDARDHRYGIFEIVRLYSQGSPLPRNQFFPMEYGVVHRGGNRHVVPNPSGV